MIIQILFTYMFFDFPALILTTFKSSTFITRNYFTSFKIVSSSSPFLIFRHFVTFQSILKIIVLTNLLKHSKSQRMYFFFCICTYKKWFFSLLFNWKIKSQNNRLRKIFIPFFVLLYLFKSHEILVTFL